MLFDFLKKAFSDRRSADERAALSAESIAAAEALKQQGNECLGRGELDAAASHYLEAVRLHPRYAEALNNLGFVFKEQRKYAEAEAAFSQALALSPELGQAHFNRGIVALHSGHPERAEACFERAVQLMPNSSDAYSYLANALHQQGKFEDACTALRRVLALNPDDAEARWVLAMTRIPAVSSASQSPQALREDFLLELDELDKWFHPGRIGKGYLAVGSAQPFYLAYQEVSNKTVMARYGALCHKLMDHWPEIDAYRPTRLASEGRIRIGIVSHLCNHSVWLAITKGWLQHLDRDRFELYIYYLDSVQDGETAAARSLATGFIEGKSSLAEWAEAIVSQRIEVLLFPEIGMTAMTAKLANLRLAPVQAVAWGHPETSGLPTIDYYFSAEYFEAENAQENYTEKLVKLPNLGCCYAPLNVTPISPDLRQLGIDSDCPLLLCPGAPFKYAPEHDYVFVEIARRLGKCQLVFFAEPRKKALVEKLAHRLEHVFRQAGLDFGEYVVFVPFLDRPAFYGLMRRADVFLDTIGFSGFNTAMQAVECGLPIVTREGRFLRGRLASGILKRIDLAELVADNEEDYVSLAVKLARDRAYAQQIRQRIEASRHVLFDDRAPARALEDFLSGVCRSTAKDEETPFEFAWQLLDAEVHMHTLKPGNAPVKLLEMIKPSPQRILDVGCFCGGSGRWLQQKFPGCAIVGIEKLPAAAAMAAEVYDKVVVKAIEQMDFAAEGIAPNSFDAIVAADVLEHLYNPWQTLQRLRHLLAPGGALYISLPNVRNLGLIGALAAGEWKYSGSGLLDITHIRFFTRAQAVELLEQTGWRVEELSINPDATLMASLQGRELDQIRSVSAGRIKLDDLTQDDAHELFGLQFHIRALPVQ